MFVSLIPFLRNIIEYTEGNDSPEYETLTKCLHKKDGTDSINISDILSIWDQRFPKYKTKFQEVDFGSEKIVDFVYSTADQILTEEIDDKIPLENKIALSIAIRLKAEDFMIANTPDLDLSEIESNQTQELFKKYKSSATPDAAKITVLDKVVLMTPENIHLNAFMYEPLIDISLQHLIDLYTEVKSL